MVNATPCGRPQHDSAVRTAYQHPQLLKEACRSTMQRLEGRPCLEDTHDESCERQDD